MTLTLRNVLYVDAVCCILMGVVFAGWSASLEGFFGLPARLIFWAGLLLFPCAALMLLAASLARPRGALVMLIVLGNVAWVVGSVLLVTGLPVFTTPLGKVFVLVQGVAVAGIAWKEWALRPLPV
jgi:hypothetical protein